MINLIYLKYLYPLYRKAKEFVTENVLKKRRREAKTAEERKTRRSTAVTTATQKRKEYHDRAEKYANEYAATKRSLIDEKRKVSKRKNNFYQNYDFF